MSYSLSEFSTESAEFVYSIEALNLIGGEIVPRVRVNLPDEYNKYIRERAFFGGTQSMTDNDHFIKGKVSPNQKIRASLWGSTLYDKNVFLGETVADSNGNFVIPTNLLLPSRTLYFEITSVNGDKTEGYSFIETFSSSSNYFHNGSFQNNGELWGIGMDNQQFKQLEDAGNFTLLNEDYGDSLAAIQVSTTLNPYYRYKLSYDIKINEFIKNEKFPRIYTGLLYPIIEPKPFWEYVDQHSLIDAGEGEWIHVESELSGTNVQTDPLGFYSVGLKEIEIKNLKLTQY